MSSLLYGNPYAKGAYRNAPCICGSGKKMKKCHGGERLVSEKELKELYDIDRKRHEDFNEALAKAAEKKVQDAKDAKEET